MAENSDTRVEAWAPLAQAIAAYHGGCKGACLVVRSSLWADEAMSAAAYYRPSDQPLPALEQIALDACRGRVLDVGAGAGRHALVLQGMGSDVVAIDAAQEAVRVMNQRGVRQTRCVSWQEIDDGQFDTVLLLMHGIGVVGDLDGLRTFLRRAPSLLTDQGQLIFDSADLSEAFEAEGIDLSQIEIDEGGYLGEVRFELEFDGVRGEEYSWLFVDEESLSVVAAEFGFECEVIAHGTRGTYLARLWMRSGG
ncbi:MAG: class I SAM-dependent methyltransferase [bacterium]|nr:class I SAM-dependent methyltransferase [bacterium]